MPQVSLQVPFVHEDHVPPEEQSVAVVVVIEAEPEAHTVEGVAAGVADMGPQIKPVPLTIDLYVPQHGTLG